MTKLKKSEKAIFAISGLALLVFFMSPFLRDISELAMFIYYDDSKKQMNAAKKYMDSLTDKDIQTWIQRAQTHLKEDHPTDFTTKDFRVDPGCVPADLQQLGITGIEENSNYIDYMWLGGMDYTALHFERMTNGDFQVVAVYTPYSNRMIWPKTTNTAP